ncbi:DUF1453 domain-containing protein, partial [Bacillus cereus]|nr:DUF1453 domain-containing protein [Bacillus cereus]
HQTIKLETNACLCLTVGTVIRRR